MMLTFQEMEQKMIDDADDEILDQELKHVAFFKAYRPIIEKSLRDIGHSWGARECSSGLPTLLDWGTKKRFRVRAIPPTHHKNAEREYWRAGMMQITLWVGRKASKNRVPGEEWWSASVRLDGINQTVIIDRKCIRWFTITELESVLREAWIEVQQRRDGEIG